MSNELSNEIMFEAKAADERIKASLTTATYAMIDVCGELKRIKDKGLYLALGYQSFEDYTEQELGIQKRQAYYYISIGEKLSDEFLKTHGHLGVTKLALLAAAPESDREEIAQKEDINSLTVNELKAELEILQNARNADAEKIEQLTLQLEEKESEPKEPYGIVPPTEIARIKREAKAETDAAMKELKEKAAEAEKKRKEAADKLKASEDAAKKAQDEAAAARKEAAEAHKC